MHSYFIQHILIAHAYTVCQHGWNIKKHIKLLKIHLKIVVWAFHKLHITTTAKTIG